jgi:hypothetical protein
MFPLRTGFSFPTEKKGSTAPVNSTFYKAVLPTSGKLLAGFDTTELDMVGTTISTEQPAHAYRDSIYGPLQIIRTPTD